MNETEKIINEVTDKRVQELIIAYGETPLSREGHHREHEIHTITKRIKQALRDAGKLDESIEDYLGRDDNWKEQRAEDGLEPDPEPIRGPF